MRVHTPAFLLSLRFHQALTVMLVGVFLFNGALQEGRKNRIEQQEIMLSYLLSLPIRQLPNIRVGA